MKLEALDHPKTLDFASRLQVELPTAIGYLELLWAFTGKKAPQGNIGKWPDGAIARACYWMQSPDVFILALRESGFIEADNTHRLTVHDWCDHAPGWVRAKLKKLGLSFIATSEPSPEPSSEAYKEGTSDHSSEPTELDFSSDTRDDSSPLQSLLSKGSTSTSTSTREGKGRKTAAAARPLVLHTSLPVTEWDEWIEKRRKHRWPNDSTTLRKQLELLADYDTATQREILNTSMRSGWQGVFRPKTNGNGAAIAATSDFRDQWKKVLLAVKRGAYRGNGFTLGDRTDAAVRLVGSYSRIGAATEFELQQLEKRFYEAYSEAAAA